MNRLDDRIVSLVEDETVKRIRALERPRMRFYRLDEAARRAHFFESGDRELVVKYVRQILEHVMKPESDSARNERISDWGQKSAQCVFDLLGALKPEEVKLVLLYDGELLLLRRSSDPCPLFHLYVSMITNRPISPDHEGVLDTILSNSGIINVLPSLELLFNACLLPPSKGQDDGLPGTGCTAVAELASRSELAMAFVIYSIVRLSFSKFFDIEVPLFTERSDEIEASRIRALVAEVHLAATAISEVGTTISTAERTKAIIRAVLADRSPETTAVVKVIEKKASVRERARAAAQSAAQSAKMAQKAALWKKCLEGDCGDLKKAIRASPFDLAVFMNEELGKEGADKIVADLCHSAFSRRFDFTPEHTVVLGTAKFNKIYNAIKTKFPKWKGGPEGPSTRKLFKVVLKELIKQRKGVISPKRTVAAPH